MVNYDDYMFSIHRPDFFEYDKQPVHVTISDHSEPIKEKL